MEHIMNNKALTKMNNLIAETKGKTIKKICNKRYFMEK